MQTAIQHRTFPDGGFVLHRITFASENGRFSAWYDTRGTVLDAEQVITSRFTGRPASRHVKKDGPVWRMLRAVGARYVEPSF
jgi:hypothetical protein